MSSFDALPGNRASDVFEPFGSDGDGAEPIDQKWRPLLDDMESDDAGEFDGRFAGEGSDGPRRQDESDVREDEDPTSSGERARTFEEGYELGRQETTADLAVVAESLVKSVEELAAFRLRLRNRYERELLELALAVARKILHAELSKKPEIWLKMIREGTRKAVDRDEVRIRVPAVLAKFFTDHLPEMRARLDEVKELVIVEDSALQEGGCVIETPFGELDVGVDAQVDHVERQLTRIG